MGHSLRLGWLAALRLTPIIVLAGALALSAPVLAAVAAEAARYQPPPPPTLSAEAVFVTDVTSGTELFALNPDMPLPPASLTKIAAALVILERADLDDSIEIIAEDLVGPEESQVGLVAGDVLSARDLLFGALIPSGNDATRALARHVGGAGMVDPVDPEQAVTAFVSLMNEKARELGAEASQFKNPTGIDAEGHVMSARDLATLAAAALGDPLFTEIVSTPDVVLESRVRPDGYPVQTTNLLLQEGFVTGVKTGSTPEAGGCLVTSFPVGSNTVIAVVLGSALSETPEGVQDNTARFADTRALIESVNASYAWVNPSEPGAIDGLLDELGVWQVAIADGVLLPVPVQDAPRVRYRLVLQPPGASDESAGAVQFFVDEHLLSERVARQTG